MENMAIGTTATIKKYFSIPEKKQYKVWHHKMQKSYLFSIYFIYIYRFNMTVMTVKPIIIKLDSYECHIKINKDDVIRHKLTAPKTKEVTQNET